MECLKESGVDRPTMSKLVKEIKDMLRYVGMNLTFESVASPSSSNRFQDANEFPTGPPLQQLIFWSKAKYLYLKSQPLIK